MVKNRCTAHARTGQQCKRSAMLGTTVCDFHGGKAPQVLAAARRRLELAHITPERTLLEIARIAYSDVASFFHPDGTLLTPAELDEDQRATLASFEACIANAESGDNKQDLLHKVKAWDKTKALEMLSKHFGLLQEKVEHVGTLTVRWATPEENQG